MKTQRSERIHIGIFGNRNAGKSSLLNTLTGQTSSIVSSVKGTTTDSIYKPMEIHGLGPVVFIDTAGLDDMGDLGSLRVDKTLKAMDKCDLFIYLLSEDDERFIDVLKSKNKKIIFIVSKGDLIEHKKVLDRYQNLNPFVFIAGDDKKKMELIELIKDNFDTKVEKSITSDLVNPNDHVLLITPQDIQAPKGRLIMPQVQTIRELLDKKSLIHISSVDNMGEILNNMKKDPDLIITDSQYFSQVKNYAPKNSKLTSFSVLFSAYKGDIDYFLQSVHILDNPNKVNKILIAEACTHPPLEEDIGRVKIPRLLRERFSKEFDFDFSRGDDFEDLNKYDLIIHCGACMFNRVHVLNRIEKAKSLKVPMTNYGIVIAYLKNILDDLVY